MHTPPLEKNKRLMIKGLVVECPLHKPMKDCPLNPLRHLPISQINKAVNQLSDKKIDSLIELHRECFEERTRKSRKKKSSS